MTDEIVRQLAELVPTLPPIEQKRLLLLAVILSDKTGAEYPAIRAAFDRQDFAEVQRLMAELLPAFPGVDVEGA